MIIKSIISNVCKQFPLHLKRTMSSTSNLHKIIDELESFAPLQYAESWDNVGLLIEPYTSKTIEKIFLTNDLTEPVLMEALEKKADLIISYHPPVFAPLKRVTQKTWKERIVSICLENKIALYSPHTAWDVAKNGVNDWLASALPYEEIVPLKPITDLPQCGIGRKIKVKDGITLKIAIENVKKLIGLENVHVAIGNSSNLNSPIRVVALCAGAGASVLKNIEADLYLTGEMSHHEVLDAIQNNISVILCNHSNSERGFLKKFKEIFDSMLKNHSTKVDIIISECDSDPLCTY